MRGVARRVGATLRAEVDFRGPFTVDGVMTVDGFRPTELNPRSGAGTRALVIGAPDLPLQLVYDAIVGGVPLDWEPKALEDLVVATADAHRFGATWRSVPARVAEHRDTRLVHDGRRWCPAGDGDVNDVNGTLVAGGSAVGGFVRLSFDDRHPPTPVGASVGPAAADFYAFCDDHLGTGIGPLASARPVR
jgi:hypothetical protein